MRSEEILALYGWALGVCFRHAAKGVIDTTPVKTIHPRIDGEKEIRACRDCILAMEGIREKAARRAGTEYIPGRAGEAMA
ncbi:hypothetical protein [Streptomyces formicae]